jgi:hypothetical protein
MSREGHEFPIVDVACHAGYRGEETPRRFQLGDGYVEVAEVVDRWLAPDHRYFKVHDTQGDLYILRHDVAADRWELTLFRRGGNREASLSEAGRLLFVAERDSAQEVDHDP